MKKNILIFALVCFFSVFYSCGEKKEAENKDETKRLRPVRAVKAEIPQNGKVKIFSGVISSSLSSKLSFKVPGTICKINVDKGDNVKKGEVIASLDSIDYELKVQEVLGSLARAKAQWKNAEAVYSRVTSLYERGNASISEVDQTRAAFDSARAVVESVEKQVELVKRNLEYTKLFAPMDCNIASVHSEENENIQPGQPIAVVNCGNSMEVNIQVPSSFLSEVKKGKPALVKIDPFKDKKFKGIIKEVGTSPNALNTSYPVTISLGKNLEGIRPGMSAIVEIEPKSLESNSYPVLPPVCVGEDSRGNFVWKLDFENKTIGIIQKVYVELGDFFGSKIIVTKGIEPGEFFVSAGVSQVRQGLKVRVETQN